MTEATLERADVREAEPTVEAILDSTWFQPEQFKTLDYVKGFVGAKVIFQMLQLGVFDDLLAGKSLAQIAEGRKMDAYLLRTVFEYLAVEGLLVKEGEGRDPQASFRLSDYGSRIKHYEGWFNILIGGYDSIFSNVGAMLTEGIDGYKRNGRLVGVGSCQISQYDTIPITKAFIESVKPDAKQIVDFGCGNAQYLCTLVKELGAIKAVGIEPDTGAYEAGLRQVESMGMQDQIRLVNVNALDYEIDEAPDFILFGFVLQEIISQIGRPAFIEYLRKLGRKFAGSYLMVMEVNYDIDNAAAMQAPMGRGYYNPYFLLHPFTNQLLLPKREWDQIFDEAGYDVVRDEVTSAKADPTGFGICYVLKHRGEAD
ncbi:methyltransferase domain-containing protein [Burkholderia gladioli]|uniref:methyltransferase domain-containing protein n=1 Tax=Burkholderia gladioli TaxID=28095 RepID=UPI003B983922